MLAELFVLRLETILRASNPRAPTNGDTRFVPLKATPEARWGQKSAADRVSNLSAD
jgi:hypothetical protein